MVGKNNGNVILKMYDSIRRQNYTNYRIIQIDDNSDDDTISKTIVHLDKYPFLKERTSIVVTRYERNALFNRHYANMNYCKDDDIVVDLDSDDWLIGRQAFQLVNSLYQTGKMYNGEHQELWSAFLDFIIYYPGSCCPRAPIYGDFPAEVYEKKTYRNAEWRTTHLRTYLWKLYSKIDSNDYIDEINIRKG
jgi:glycosyltransferase involved in cell wall biosynthesis